MTAVKYGAVRMRMEGRMAFYHRCYRCLKKVNTALLGLALSMGMSAVHAEEAKKVDVLLIGGGIMSATLVCGSTSWNPAPRCK